MSKIDLAIDEKKLFRPRKTLRLPSYDYRQAGAYFITICAAARKKLFGHVIDGCMQENNIGNTVQAVWTDLTNRFKIIETDAFVVMPNHIHGIIVVGSQFIATLDGSMNRAPTLGEIVRVFKAVSTKEIRANYLPRFAWQRNYYEHVIRDDDSLNLIREYIHTNPLRWELDRENPSAKGKDNFDIWLEKFKREGLTKTKSRPQLKGSK